MESWRHQRAGAIGWRPSDGWTAEWRAWFSAPGGGDHRAIRRLRAVQEAVRGAVAELPVLERVIIERHFFDGRSWRRIADETALSLIRVHVLRRRALGRLRDWLAPFVRTMYGLETTVRPECAICRASWRQIAEDLLDEKTPEVTWGMLARRLERAVGWTPTTIQILIGHQKNHRVYSRLVPETGQRSRFAAEIEEVA